MDKRALTALAQQLRAMADMIETAVSDADAMRTAALAAAMNDLKADCAAGKPMDLATLEVAAEHGLPHHQVHFRWQFHEFKRDAELRRRQALRLADLTAAGLPDREIGRILGLHPKSLPRIRRRMREEKNPTKIKTAKK